MFEGITKGLSGALKSLRGRGRLTADNIREGLREVRRALLEADVNLTVVTDFIQKVETKAIGQDVLAKVDPSEQIVKIVYEELVALMGPVDHGIPRKSDRPVVLMLCGLQGAGKTTTAAKLALNIQSLGRKPLLAAADLQRPGAVEQLQTLGQQLGIEVYSEKTDPVSVCKNAVARAKQTLCDTVILDTAGRLQIDDELMAELKAIDKQVKPDAAYLVVDAMIGQEAVNVARSFDDALGLNACILTKLDGDARGGAALSIKHVTGVPIKYIGVGEKVDKLEEFHPERMAGRILGQGDMMGVVEKIQSIQKQMSQEELKKQQEALEKGKFTLNDFRKQFAMISQLGMKDMISRMPGMADMIPPGEDPEDALKKVQGMIDSMTKAERLEPDIIDASRRKRIATGCGVEPHQIKQFLMQFNQVRTLMKQMASMSIWQRMKMMSGLSNMGAINPNGMLNIKTKGDTGHRKSPKERAEERKKKKKKR
ncbi:MAG: signal recognition particle protein [Bacteroidales bacterium]|nr:signal recognition particle protein [Bacteroidales bacterium]